MKKIISKILVIMMTIGLLYVPTESAYAASLSVTVDKSTVKIGDTVTVSVTVPGGYSADIDMKYPSDVVSFESGSVTTSNNGTKIAFTVGSFGSTSTDPTTATFKFKAKSVGTVSFEAVPTVAGDSTGMPVEMGKGSASVSIVNEIYSDDASLSIMYLSQGYISPDFSPSITTYRTTVDYSVTSVRVTATPNHSKATVISVTGNENLQVGENTISVVVKAESGATATYKVIVTRAEKPADAPDQPSESETPGNTEGVVEGTDSGFDWKGKDLYFTESLPEGNAVKDFEKDTILINNLNVPCLKHSKSNIVVLNLKNDIDGGSLYVYDTNQKYIYPYIKLEANNVYIIALQPDESVEAPEGYSACTLQIEGKGTITAYQYTARTLSDFYLLYCVNNNGQFGWYQYDSVEGTFQRFTGQAPSTSVTPNEGDGDTQESPSDTQANADDNELAALLKAEKNKNIMMLCIFIFVVAVLLVVIINLILSRRRPSEEELEEEIEAEAEELLEEEYVEEVEEELAEAVKEEVKASELKESAENVEEDDDEIEIEFYEMAEEMPVEGVSNKETTDKKDDDDDFEFIDL